MFDSCYSDKRVFLTGHTGFKGSWLSEWLLSLGAQVYGYALDPQDHEVLYDRLDLSSRLRGDTRADLSDRSCLREAMEEAQPDIVFHLAAQPLVRLSYEKPVETFQSNVMGTAYLLDAVRLAKRNCAVVCVTTDKCYDNREWLQAYREEDALGGHDPYSASKAAAEIVLASYRKSFFDRDSGVKLASARAGNVIGGGDWAVDRIIPDCVRAVRSEQAIPIRNKLSTRPWQHVLEPLSGYLHLGATLAGMGPENEAGSDWELFCSPFNFGPGLTSNRTVAELVQTFLQHTGGDWIDATDSTALHEASKLNLATDKAYHLLGWEPVWDFDGTVSKTADWYLQESQGVDPGDLTRSQIESYQACAVLKKIRWAK